MLILYSSTELDFVLRYLRPPPGGVVPDLWGT